VSQKSSIATNFSKKIALYESNASIQRAVSKELFEGSDLKGFSSLLDIGCGSGFLIDRALERGFGGEIYGIDISKKAIQECTMKYKNGTFECVDAESFESPFRYDIVVSSFVFQWFDDPLKAIKKYKNMLNKNGLFLLALPIEGSLKEFDLKGEGFEFMTFPHSPSVKKIFKDEFGEFNYKKGCFKEYHKSALCALRSIKNIGATYRVEKSKSFTETKKTLSICEERFLEERGFPLTFEVAFFEGRV